MIAKVSRPDLGPVPTPRVPSRPVSRPDLCPVPTSCPVPTAAVAGDPSPPSKKGSPAPPGTKGLSRRGSFPHRIDSVRPRTPGWLGSNRLQFAPRRSNIWGGKDADGRHSAGAACRTGRPPTRTRLSVASTSPTSSLQAKPEVENPEFPRPWKQLRNFLGPFMAVCWRQGRGLRPPLVVRLSTVSPNRRYIGLLHTGLLRVSALSRMQDFLKSTSCRAAQDLRWLPPRLNSRGLPPKDRQRN